MLNKLREIDNAEWFHKHTQLFKDCISEEDASCFIEEKQEYAEIRLFLVDASTLTMLDGKDNSDVSNLVIYPLDTVQRIEIRCNGVNTRGAPMRDAIVDLHIYPRGVRERGVGVAAGPPNAITMRGERPDKCKEL